MKKHLSILLLTGAFGTANAQLPVSTAPQNKKVVLEEFTGIYCGYCPDGHTRANAIYSADPTNVVLINIHSGGFANVATGEPDLKTTEGTAIDGMPGMGITGYPSGDVNRTVLTGSVMAANRGDWATMAATVKTQTAYCNVALQGTLNATTRVLTVDAAVYYTANSPVASNSLSIVLLEDDVLGPQHNYGNPYWNLANYNVDDSYNHNHVLRKALTPTFGLTIPNATMGTTFTTSVSYTVPATFGAAGKTNPCVLGNLKLAAFVTQTNSLTINAAHGPITVTNIPNTLDAGVGSLKADAEVCAGNISPSYMVLSNGGSTAITSAVITYSVAGATAMTYNFTGNIPALTHTVIGIPSYSFAAGASNVLNIAVTSVNGGPADAVTANNVTTKTLPLTTKISNSTLMSMIFTTDAYGSETSWLVANEVTGATIASGGPYTNLSASGTSVQPTVNFTVAPNTCYKVVVTDSYGDGFNNGYGAGNYVIKANGTNVFTMNGQMSSTEDIKLFKASTTANGLNETSTVISNVSVYPNPALTASSVDIDLVQNDNVTVEVMSVTGQIVFTQTLSNASAGKHVVNMNTENWANGVYNIHVSTTEGSVNRKLVVSK
jgi:hypothetical protein